MKEIGLLRCWGCVSALILGLLTGCGGGGGDDDDDSDGKPPEGDRPLAVESVAGQVLTFIGASTNREIAFAASGNGWTQSDLSDGGTYVYRKTGANTAELTLAGAEREEVVGLEFRSSDSGIYQVRGVDAAEGPFQLRAVSSNPPDEDPNGPGDGGGLPPATLDGRTMFGTRTFTSTGPVGQTHVYTFRGGSFHDSDPPEESDGFYTYEPSGDQARLLLNYTEPEDFNGDRHELRMTFFGADRGTFESVYTRRDGTVIEISGTFEIE